MDTGCIPPNCQLFSVHVNGQIITVFRTLYLGLSYKGALIDRLSIEELQRLWEFIYQEYKL